LTSISILSEDYLRAQLMRSTSDEAVHSKSEEDNLAEDDNENGNAGGGARGGANASSVGRGGRPSSPPLYKPRPLRFPAPPAAALSPQSAPSDEESSYQVSFFLIREPLSDKPICRGPFPALARLTARTTADPEGQADPQVVLPQAHLSEACQALRTLPKRISCEQATSCQSTSTKLERALILDGVFAKY